MNKNLFNLLVSALLLACIGITLVNLDFASAEPDVYAYPYTLSATNISDTTATLNSRISATAGTDSFVAYFKYYEYGTKNQIQQTYQIEYNETNAVNGYVYHSQSISGLKSNTTYYYWVEIGNKGQYFHGDMVSFTTTGGSYDPTPVQPVNPVTPVTPVQPVTPVTPVTPVVPTAPATQLQVQTVGADYITATSARLNGNLTSLGNANFANVWFEFNDGQRTTFLFVPIANAANGNTTQQAMYSTGNFSFALNGLYPNRTYTFRAVAQNNSGTVFGQTMQFTTGAQAQSSIIVPPSNTSTGFEDDIKDFAYLGLFLSGILLFVFRKHIVYVNDFATNVAYATINNKTLSSWSDKMKNGLAEFRLSRKIGK